MVPCPKINGCLVFISATGSGFQAFLGQSSMVFGLKNSGFTELFHPQRLLDYSSAVESFSGLGKTKRLEKMSVSMRVRAW